MRKFDPLVWGPHYWFFIQTLALSYPDFPNEIIKRKFYDFFLNLPLFIPDVEMGQKFSTLLDKYPVASYLGSKDSLVRWVVFIHNKYNEMLGKDEISIDEAMSRYYDLYLPKPVHIHEELKVKRYYLHVAFIVTCLFLVYLYWQ
jgi:hypothetical protein